MKRSRLSLEQVAAWDNLTEAFILAARGKRRRAEVLAFEAQLESELGQLSEQILKLTVPVGNFVRFQVYDPKLRQIEAPVFRERVLHHALMRLMGPVIDRSLVDDSYACRVGKGTHRAVARARAHIKKYPWFVKVDMQAYFASIPHRPLMAQLTRKFKDPGLLALCHRLLTADGARSQGLPIGALTSQHWANLYLAPLDRLLLEHYRVDGYARYMDDVVWWCSDKTQAQTTLAAVREWVPQTLGLALHPSAYVQRSSQGLSFLGYRIYPHTLRLSRRRQRRYRAAVARWEAAYLAGKIDALTLQQNYAAAYAIVADCPGWLRSRPWREGLEA